ncbi:MAG: endonuclease/exonuclease/phosphatase family protein, partial [bacterium]
MKFLKIFVLLTGGITAIILSWYSVSRIRSISNPLSVYSFEENMTEKNTFETDRLKVASYNIAHARGGKYGAKNWNHNTEKELLKHLDKIVEQIKNEHPDIIVLNEIDFSSAWSFNINQAKYIGKNCGYAYILEQKNMDVSFPFYRFCFGNAILSKYPIENEKFIDFHPYSKLEDIFAGNHDAFFCELKLTTGRIGI